MTYIERDRSSETHQEERILKGGGLGGGWPEVRYGAPRHSADRHSVEDGTKKKNIQRNDSKQSDV
jgi:hypothetical protein